MTDPEATVRLDVERVRGGAGVSPRISVSGHVYVVTDGTLRTVVPAEPVGADAELAA